jgi:hypothetical protein
MVHTSLVQADLRPAKAVTYTVSPREKRGAASDVGQEIAVPRPGQIEYLAWLNLAYRYALHI